MNAKHCHGKNLQVSSLPGALWTSAALCSCWRAELSPQKSPHGEKAAGDASSVALQALPAGHCAGNAIAMPIMCSHTVLRRLLPSGLRRLPTPAATTPREAVPRLATSNCCARAPPPRCCTAARET